MLGLRPLQLFKGLKVQALQRPLSITSVRDGCAYALRSGPLVQTNFFLMVGCVDEVFVKVPSKGGRDDYFRFLKPAQTTPSDVRPFEDDERFERLQETIDRFPDLEPLLAATPETAHYLAVHKLQYERLRADRAVNVPAARFGMLRSGRFLPRLEPALFQERVPGTTLWEMYDFEAESVLPRWRPFLPAISAQLSNLLDSQLLTHIDWNIHNFVFHADQRLFYVDMKPSTLVARESNERNLKGIREHFVV